MQYVRPVGFVAKPVAPRQRLVIDATAGGVALTVPASAIVATCRLEDAQVRFTLDGTAPTAGAGQLLDVGDRLTLEGRSVLTGFLAIRTGASNGVLDAEFFTADY